MKSMKRISSLIAALVLLSTSASTAFAQTLYLHYDFNGATDSATAVNSGALGGNFNLNYVNAAKEGITQGSTAGVGGGAGNYAFNNNSATWAGAGGAARTATANFGDLTLQSFTITFWANPEGNWVNNSRIFVAGGNNLALRVASNGALWLTVNSVADKEIASADGFLVNGTGAREWTFYAVTFTADGVSFYRGTETESVQQIGSVVTTARDSSGLPAAWIPAGTGTNLGVGNNPDSSQNRAMKGLLDEVSLYGAETGLQGALSLEAIESIRTTGAIPEPGTASLLMGGLAGATALAMKRRRL